MRPKSSNHLGGSKPAAIFLSYSPIRYEYAKQGYKLYIRPDNGMYYWRVEKNGSVLKRDKELKFIHAFRAGMGHIDLVQHREAVKAIQHG